MNQSYLYTGKMLENILKEIYRVKFGSSFAREVSKQEEIFIAFLLMDFYGLPNPVKLLAIEYIPLMMESFHRWHKSLGMEKSPLEWLRCC